MAQAWHRTRVALPLGQRTKAKYWCATKYELDNLDKPTAIRAAPGALWRQFSPLDSYTLTSKARDLEAGPHLKFLKLKGLWTQRSEHFYKALVIFAEYYGLLGTFVEDYLQRLILAHRSIVAPDAVIDKQGRLRRVNPATEGRELLLDLLEPRGWLRRAFLFSDFFERDEKYQWIALPSEVSLVHKRPDLQGDEWSEEPIETRALVPWDVFREDFGALLVLDEGAFKGVSVLCTREPLDHWTRSLRNFPSAEETPVKESKSAGWNIINSYLQEVSPYVFLGENGNLEPGWRCHNLLQAMYVMLYLDLTGDNTIKKCQRRGCANYFRMGTQSKSKYCTNRCANLASTRMSRGQEP